MFESEKYKEILEEQTRFSWTLIEDEPTKASFKTELAVVKIEIIGRSYKYTFINTATDESDISIGSLKTKIEADFKQFIQDTNIKPEL